MHKKTRIGMMGEHYVCFKLARECNLRSEIISDFFDYDVLAEKNIRIEVKSASPSKSEKKYKNKTYVRDVWKFNNYQAEITNYKSSSSDFIRSKRNRDCDFFAFVCFDEDEDVEAVFVVPKNEIGTSMIVSIPRSEDSTSYLTQYRNNWELITQFK